MEKSKFTSNELSELEALQILGGSNSTSEAQAGCINKARGCGINSNQASCVNNVYGCG